MHHSNSLTVENTRLDCYFSLEEFSGLPIDPVTRKALVWNAKTRTLISADGKEFELGF
jgi:hypothetical protein